MMKQVKISGILCAAMLSLSLCSSAREKKHKNTNRITLGFQTGKEITFNTQKSLLATSKKNIPSYPTTTGMFYFRKPLCPRFKVQGGLSYSFFQGLSKYNKVNTPANNGAGIMKPYKVSMPVTIQYYLLPEHSRIRPYFGAGLQYNFGGSSFSNFPPGSNDTKNSFNYYRQEEGTKYINLLFTQGVTFEINTTIQINQSFHFIPDNNIKTIGIDLGIGYTFP